MIRQLSKATFRFITKSSRLKQLSKLESDGLPKKIVPIAKYLITNKCDKSTNEVVLAAESRRAEIAAQGQKQVPIWYSPKPNSADTTKENNERPEPGETLYFTMERIANTGKNKRWGTALHLITRAYASTTAIELGSCAGISAMYFASAPTMQKFITIEGSKELSKIASESLNQFSNSHVINNLFDEALDETLPNLGKTIDLTYIDGHHEKVATIHYFNKLLPYLKPGAVVIFDDVSWSYDMREAWDELSKRSEFSHSIDFGTVGVCILKECINEDTKPPKYWNLQPVTGKHPIGQPHGWKK